MNISFENISEDIASRMREIRHYLHRNPEPSWNERGTTKIIRQILSELEGIEFIETGLSTGVLAVLHGNELGPTVALRADIDALHVEETWAGPCRSEREGLGHLCGHDFHTAALLGAAMMLAEVRNGLHGNVLFIFQPAEETTDGARALIAHGLYEKCPFQAVFGLHNRPEVPTGHVVVKRGALMAAKINFKIVVHGVGGHGSMPHRCVDPVVCAAAIVQTVLTIPSRNVDPMEAMVASICSIHGGTPDNLIVDRVEMTGAMRYLDEQTGERGLQRLKTIVESVAETYECTSEFEITERVRPVFNDERLYPLAMDVAERIFGQDAVESSSGCLATEDFSEYMRLAPGWFYWLGNRKPDEGISPWHNSNFHVDDDALPYGARLLATSAWAFLDSDRQSSH